METRPEMRLKVYRDLREFLEACDAHNDAIHVKREVDCNLEMGKALKKSYEGRSPVVYFDNPLEKSFPAVGGVFSNRAKALLAFEATEDTIHQKFINGIANPISPVMIEGTAPCQEIVLLGDDIDLDSLPIPRFSPLDGGSFITAGLTVSKDPESEVPDVGHYRYQYHDKKTLGYMAQPFHRFGKNCNKALSMGLKSWQAAIVIGGDPLMHYCGPLVGVSDDSNDYAFMGGLRGAPVELVKCKTVDLEVPAWAEFIIEIEVDFETKKMEGPLGEFTGYQTPASEKWVSHVKAITHRKNPLFQILLTGQPVTENHILKNVPFEASLYSFLKQQYPTVKAVNVLPAGGVQTEVVISMVQRNYGEARHVILAAMASNLRPKYVVVVDDDIDVHNLDQVNWAIAYRSTPGKDTIVIEDVPSSPLDPSSSLPALPDGEIPDWGVAAKMQISGSLGIDATFPFGVKHAEVAVVPGWEEYDFPELDSL